MNPKILCQPNVPKPLHGVNPRTIMGQAEWDILRRSVYEKAGHRCDACGVPVGQAKKHRWLECHELWDIDYKTGLCRVPGFVALCHYCHNFIHNGRLYMIAGQTKSFQEVKEIMEHGFGILSHENLPAFYGAFMTAELVGAETFGVESWEPPPYPLRWSDWRLEYNGKIYTQETQGA